MGKRWVMAVLAAVVSVGAHADALEVSGFGGYTNLGMKNVNGALAGVKNTPLLDQTTTTDINNGYVAGLDIRTGWLIPVPYLAIGPRVEYVGAANAGEAAGKGVIPDYGTLPLSYKTTENASMLDAMLGLSFGMTIPGVKIGIGAGIYGGYGQGLIQQSETVNGATATDLYTGGNFVAEGEIRLSYKLVSVLNLYAFGGRRYAELGTFQDAAKTKFFVAPGSPSSPTVDFSGTTGGLGLDLDF